MRLDLDHDSRPTVRVSVRNLRALLAKAGQPDSARTIVSGNCWREGRHVGSEWLLIITVANPSFAGDLEAVVTIGFAPDLLRMLIRAPGTINLDGIPIHVESDKAHYRDRAPAGHMHPTTELLIAGSEPDDAKEGETR